MIELERKGVIFLCINDLQLIRSKAVKFAVLDGWVDITYLESQLS
jgi:hypothetical protein